MYLLFDSDGRREIKVTATCHLAERGEWLNGWIRHEMPGNLQSTVEPGYNDIGLCDTSSVTSGVLWL
jgi:hypothetical protein